MVKFAKNSDHLRILISMCRWGVIFDHVHKMILFFIILNDLLDLVVNPAFHQDLLHRQFVFPVCDALL